MTTAFRKWTKSTVKESGTLITTVDQLRIIGLEKISYRDITDNDILKDGYDNRTELDSELDYKSDGQLYKISFRLEQEDLRIKLREKINLSEEELNKLAKKLEGFDTKGKIKDWMLRVMDIINEKPKKPSIYYANTRGYEQMWFKASVRKLKNLGLTISHKIGYELSPRGKINSTISLRNSQALTSRTKPDNRETSAPEPQHLNTIPNRLGQFYTCRTW